MASGRSQPSSSWLFPVALCHRLRSDIAVRTLMMETSLRASQARGEWTTRLGRQLSVEGSRDSKLGCKSKWGPGSQLGNRGYLTGTPPFHAHSATFIESDHEACWPRCERHASTVCPGSRHCRRGAKA